MTQSRSEWFAIVAEGREIEPFLWSCDELFESLDDALRCIVESTNPPWPRRPRVAVYVPGTEEFLDGIARQVAGDAMFALRIVREFSPHQIRAARVLLDTMLDGHELIKIHGVIECDLVEWLRSDGQEYLECPEVSEWMAEQGDHL